MTRHDPQYIFPTSTLEDPFQKLSSLPDRQKLCYDLSLHWFNHRIFFLLLLILHQQFKTLFFFTLTFPYPSDWFVASFWTIATGNVPQNHSVADNPFQSLVMVRVDLLFKWQVMEHVKNQLVSPPTRVSIKSRELGSPEDTSVPGLSLSDPHAMKKFIHEIHFIADWKK